MGAMSNYLENKVIDWLFRGQSFSPPPSLHVGLLSSAPSDSGGGTEITGNGYARQNLAATLANWAGTQSAGSITASSGVSGTTSNNVAITFPTPTASWGAVSHFGIFDSATGGNLLFHGPLGIPKTINQGDTVTFPISTLSVQIDD
jgi:hypothetical protein